MKKMLVLSHLIYFVALSTLNSAKAQNFSQGSVIIDGIALNPKDSITCYKFKTLQIAFPITEQLFLHDKIVFSVTLNNRDTAVGQGNGFSYYVNLLKKDVISNFENKKYGVITIIDENRANVSLFADPIGVLNKKEFYTIYGGHKLAFKPMLVEIASMDITSYQEEYVESMGSFVKHPLYGNSKVIFRKKVEFFNTIDGISKTTTNYESSSSNSLLGSVIRIKPKTKKTASPETVKEGTQKDVENGCNMPAGTFVTVKMNTNVDLDTFFGTLNN